MITYDKIPKFPGQRITQYQPGDRVAVALGATPYCKGTVVRAGDLNLDMQNRWRYQVGPSGPAPSQVPNYLVVIEEYEDGTTGLGFCWDELLSPLIEEAEKEVFYVAHPVSGDIQANIDNVVQWIKWLTLNDPSRVYIAPWVAEVMAFKDMGELDPAFYDRVLQDDVTVLRKLDGILMVGGNISRGMGIERDGMRPGMTLQDWSYARTPADLKPEHIEALGCQ